MSDVPTTALTKVSSKSEAGHPDFRSGMEQEGMIELAVPNLLPTDNASEVVEVTIKRVRIPVRIRRVNIEAIDNGYIVNLPEAGQSSMFGPDGGRHAFAGDGAKQEMIEFVATVVGQVTFQYREVEQHEVQEDPPKAYAGDGGGG